MILNFFELLTIVRTFNHKTNDAIVSKTDYKSSTKLCAVDRSEKKISSKIYITYVENA